MKKYILTLVFVFGLNVFASLPINIEPKVSLSYQKSILSKEDFSKFELDNYLKENLEYYDVLSSIGVRTSYPIKYNKHNLSLGLNLDFLVSYSNLLNDDRSYTQYNSTYNDQVKKDYLEAKEEFDIKNQEYDAQSNKNNQIYNRARVILFNKILNIKTKRSIQDKLDELEEAKSKYPTQADVDKLAQDVEAKDQAQNQAAREASEIAKKISDFLINLGYNPSQLTRDEYNYLKANYPEYKQLSADYVAKVNESTKLFQEYLNLSSDKKIMDVYDTLKEKKLKELQEAEDIETVLDEEIDAFNEFLEENGIEERSTDNLIRGYDEDNDLFPELERQLSDKYVALGKASNNLYDKKEEYDQLPSAVDEKSFENFKKDTKNILSLGAAVSFNTTYYYNIQDSFDVFFDLNLGLQFNENKLYKVLSKLEKDKVKDKNNNKFIKPNDIKKINTDLFVDLGFGVKYKNFKSRIYSGYNRGLVGLELGYQF